MKKLFLILMCMIVLMVCTACDNNDNIDTPNTHNHDFIDGFCSCGEKDPNADSTNIPQHIHTFIDGKCQCGKIDGNNEYIDNELHAYSIDLNQYFTYNFQGYNGAGRVTTIFNYEKFYLDHISNIDFKNDAAKTTYGLVYGDTIKEPAQILMDHISWHHEPLPNMSNGDVVSFVWDIDFDMINKYFDVSLRYKNEAAIVKDLEPLIDVDIFDYISLEYIMYNTLDTSVELNAIWPDNIDSELKSRCSSLLNDRSNFIVNKNELSYTNNEILVTLKSINFANYGLNPTTLSKKMAVNNYKFMIPDATWISDQFLNKVKNEFINDLKKEKHLKNINIEIEKVFLTKYDNVTSICVVLFKTTVLATHTDYDIGKYDQTIVFYTPYRINDLMCDINNTVFHDEINMATSVRDNSIIHVENIRFVADFPGTRVAYTNPTSYIDGNKVQILSFENNTRIYTTYPDDFQPQNTILKLNELEDSYTIVKYSNGDMCFYPKGYNTDDWDTANDNINSTDKSYAKIYYSAATKTGTFYYITGTFMQSASWPAGEIILSDTINSYNMSIKNGRFKYSMNQFSSVTGWCQFNTEGIDNLIPILVQIYNSGSATVEFKDLHKISISQQDKNAVLNIIDLYIKYFDNNNITIVE